MKRLIEKTLIGALPVVLFMTTASRAAIIITEAHPTGSSNVTYAVDWFELTNTGPSTVDIAGWKMDDNTNLFANAVAIRGNISITPGASVVLAEGNTTGTTDATIQADFITAWFGGSAPAGFQMGFYGGSSVGLSGTTDAVNVFDAGGATVARVDFGAATTGTSFDNSAGLNNVSISTLSAPGVKGAFTAPSGEIGSPGVAAVVVPEPASLALLTAGIGTLLLRRKRA